MIRPTRAPVRSVYNQSSSLSNETSQSSTNAGDITSYIGKILTINHHQVIVEDILGQGGFAFVFLARSYNQQKYALKRMYVNNPRDLHVCQREISLLKEFSTHPNIVKYVDSFVHRLSPTNIQRRQYYTGGNGDNDNDDDEDDAIYEILLLTEYCSNGALINRLNEQRNVGLTLNERQILRVFADICHAVSACHFRRPQPVLHRDIKLENILMNSHQSYVLCDFGSAILLSPSTTNDFQQYSNNQLTTNVIQQLEEEIQRYTTLCYRAPEMIDLYSRLPITLKTDIWAMGCLLYKLMYNTMPFGDSILAIQNGIFTIPDDMAQVYSRDLNLLVRYMLEIDINKRPDIWQVSYITYKLLGVVCPIPNRCQSKIPDLHTISMPLTESESRHQRTTALSKAKSTSTNFIDESLSLGTAVNPRDRPRGMIVPSTSLVNFNQTNQQSATIVVPPPKLSNPSRSGSAAQLMFDDDFSKIPSHAISLTNIPTLTSTTKNEQIISRARPSPPTTISAASGFALHQQLLPPPPSSSSSDVHSHRRSSSQTVSPSNIQSSFQKASSVDTSSQDEASDDDDADQLKTNFNKLKDHNYSTFNSDDEQILLSISSENRKIPTNSQVPITIHHPSTEEAEKYFSFSNPVKSIMKHSSEQHSTKGTSLDDNLNNSFDQLVNEDFNTELDSTTNSFNRSILSKEHSNQANPSNIDTNNPFLRAPFHHSPANKQSSASSSINVDGITSAVNTSSFDADSIISGEKSSAFARYQKQEINSDNDVIDTTNNSGILMAKLPHSESFPPGVSSSSTNVFINAPFKPKTTNKQRSSAANRTSPILSLNNKTNMMTDIETQQLGYSNLSFDETVVDEYF